ncbi:MAG: efflux RND transporter periplasmic adaptor subunit [Steroidobacteraceae bacterium]|nr:efflux RND transporter periplasmic adaptor subunit [Steroidobacteraceae bacterium]
MTVAACGDRGPPAPAYETAAVERRSIAVVVEAAGVVEPVSTVEVKSKASGEILRLGAEIGDTVAAGHLLASIDPRTPRNRVAQAEAELNAARARHSTARSQLERGDRLLAEKWINPAEHEALALEVANTRAQVIAAEVALENARIALEDTEVRAPSAGTILTRLVEPGQVISSPTQDVGGGTVLLTMADLGHVRARVRVDETDIGKLAPGIPARVTVAAYPARGFEGVIEKIEPKAVVEQNVTLFSVLISIANEDGLLRPGMNVEAVFDVVRRDAVLTLPVMALRTARDVDTTAGILDVDADELRAQLGAAPAAAPRAERGPRPPGGGASPAVRLGGNLWVVAVRSGSYMPTAVQTGVTDLDRVEITGGLEEGDRVLLLPSASLVETQQQIQNFASRRGGIPGITQRPAAQPGGQPAAPGR